MKGPHCQESALFAESKTKSTASLAETWMQREEGTTETVHKCQPPHLTQWSPDRLLKYMDNSSGLNALFKVREVPGFNARF